MWTILGQSGYGYVEAGWWADHLSTERLLVMETLYM